MKRRFITFVAPLAAFPLSTALAAELYVNAAAPVGAESGTQAAPFRTVQRAIDAAIAGDVIRVAAGSYRENIRVEAKPLVLEGGYGTDWVRDLSRNTTTLQGAGNDAVVTLLGADATIDGFRITGGTGSPLEAPYGYHGGGIYSVDGAPTISNNLIEANDIRRSNEPSEYFFGGGIYVINTTNATISKNTVRNNFAGRGAGLYVNGEFALIRGNTIEGNTAIGDHGGGLFIATRRATVTENLFRGNEIGRALGYGWGGGLIVVGVGNSAELSFNVLTQNFAAGYGAAEFIDEGATATIHHELIYGNLSKAGCEAVSAIAVDGGEGGGSQASISHCTVVDNVCPDATRGNGLQVEGGSNVTVTNSIFWGNGGDDFSIDNTSRLSVTFTDSQESIAGTGNISADPRFSNPAAADYRLAAGSPCIDAADPASPFSDEPADNGGRADMGRFGGNASSAAPAPPPIGSTPGGSTPGGSTPGDTDNQDDGDTDDNGDPVSAGLCPGSAALLLSLSLVGVRRSPRRPRLN